MEPPQNPTPGRFRLRVRIYPPEASDNESVPPKRSILIAKGPALPLPDLTIQELCSKILERYKQIYPNESLFKVDKSQDESGSDLYLGDRVGDIFEDNEVFRIIQGASVRESLPPDPRAFAVGYPRDPRVQSISLEPTHSLSRKRGAEDAHSLPNVEEPSKRQKVEGLDPDRPILSCERDLPDNQITSLEPNGNDDIVPETQVSDSEGEGCHKNEKGRTGAHTLKQLHSSLHNKESLCNGGNSTVPDQELQFARTVSPASSVTTTRRESIFSCDSERRHDLLSIKPTPKKRLLSRERSFSVSTSATTPIDQEMPFDFPSVIPTGEPEKHLVKTTTPRSGGKLKRPTIFSSDRIRGASASRVYDEIEDTDRDEPATAPSSRKRRINSPVSSNASVPIGVSAQKWKTKSKQSSGRNHGSSQPSSSQSKDDRTNSTDLLKAGQENDSTRESVNKIQDQAGFPSSVFPTSSKPSEAPDNAVRRERDDDKTRQAAALKARKAIEADQRKQADAKAKLEAQRKAAEVVEARRREQAAALANKQAKARAREMEAEVVKLRVEGDIALKPALKSPHVTNVDARQELPGRSTKSTSSQSPPQVPVETPVPVPISIFKRSSTPFIPRGRATSKPLKPPGPGTPEKGPTSSKKGVGIEDQMPLPVVKRRLSFGGSTVIQPMSKAPASQPCQGHKMAQATLIPTPPQTTSRILPKGVPSSSTVRIAQRTLHSFSNADNSASDIILSSQDGGVPRSPKTSLNLADRDCKANSSENPERITDGTSDKADTNKGTAAATTSKSASGESSPEEETSSSEESSDSDDDSANNTDLLETTRCLSPRQPSTPDLIAQQLSSSALRASSCKEHVDPRRDTFQNLSAARTPSLRRMCEEMRGGKLPSSSPSRIKPGSTTTPSAILKVRGGGARRSDPKSGLEGPSETDDSSSDSDSDDSDDHPDTDQKKNGAHSERSKKPAVQALPRQQSSDLNDAEAMELARKELSDTIDNFEIRPDSSMKNTSGWSPSIQRGDEQGQRKEKKVKRTNWTMVRRNFHPLKPKGL